MPHLPDPKTCEFNTKSRHAHIVPYSVLDLRRVQGASQKRKDSLCLFPQSEREPPIRRRFRRLDGFGIDWSATN